MSGYRTINPKQPTEQCRDSRCENIYPHMAGLSCELPKTDNQPWADECPHKADAGDEYYFVRRKDRNEVVVMGFSMGKAWLNGVSYEPSELRSHLFLGPLSPSDAKQLSELRRLAIEARDVLALLVPYGKIHTVDGVKYPDGSHSEAVDRGERVLNQIRDIVGTN